MFILLSGNVLAQKIIPLDRDFNLSGELWAYSETEEGEDAIIVVEGARWHLTNEVVARRNHVKFWITAPDDDERLYYTTWSADDVKVAMIITAEKKKKYYVFDDVFTNLIIADTDNGVIIRNCSVLREE